MFGFIQIPALTARTPQERVVSTARIAMNGLDTWARDADTALRGKQVVYTGKHPFFRGRIGQITAVAVGVGASGYHMLVEVRFEDGTRQPTMELGVNCELLADDDVPSLTERT